MAHSYRSGLVRQTLEAEVIAVVVASCKQPYLVWTDHKFWREEIRNRQCPVNLAGRDRPFIINIDIDIDTLIHTLLLTATMMATSFSAVLLLLSLLAHPSLLFAPCWAYLNQIPLNSPPPYTRNSRHVRRIAARRIVGRSSISSPATLQFSFTSTSTRLYSLRPLVDEIASIIAANRQDSSSNTPVIFVGGKGGVGKTSISSALAIELASSASYDDDDDADWNVLIISTDPAHSLGDALDVDLRTQQQQSSNSNNQQPRPIVLSDPLTNRRLSALEVDPRAALSEFQDNLQRLFDMSSLSNNKFLGELGLTQELNTLLRNPPPGLDEYVALANVLDPDYNTNSMNGVGKQAYDVIIVDTAPTGHTLRMLQLPQFLDGFLRTLLSLRAKLKGLANTIQMFMGGNSEEGRSSSTASTLELSGRCKSPFNCIL